MRAKFTSRMYVALRKMRYVELRGDKVDRELVRRIEAAILYLCRRKTALETLRRKASHARQKPGRTR